jgi:hypothetical protein
MDISRPVVVFDAADMDAESSFWSAILGGTVQIGETEDDWHSVDVHGNTQLAVQLSPEHIAPDWPNGTPQQIHIDLYVDNISEAHEEAISLGAKLLQAADIDAAEGFQVYADPAGHPFCLRWGLTSPLNQRITT